MNQHYVIKALLAGTVSVIYASAQTPAVPVTATQESPAKATLPFEPVPKPVVDHELRFGSKFREFEAKDVAGRTWKAEDFQGKLTVLYLFHTFQFGVPGPVTADLPELQRFYDKVKSTRSIQVLAFCTDYDYTHATAFMAKHKFTFPVVADWALVAKLFPKDNDDCRFGCSAGVPTSSGQSIPLPTRQWVVDAEGRLSHPARSWDLNRLLLEVEKIAPLPRTQEAQ
jgi:peroxiredoxin